MKSLSSHIEPQDALDLELIRVQLWINQDDSEIEYYDLPSENISYLREFIDTGEANTKVASELRSALHELPSWKDLDIRALSKEQRECVATVYVRSKGRRLDLVFRMQLNANVF